MAHRRGSATLYGAQNPSELAVTAIVILAYVVLPVVIVAMGYAAMRLNETSARRAPHPGE
jgi:hypothetical protein